MLLRFVSRAGMRPWQLLLPFPEGLIDKDALAGESGQVDTGEFVPFFSTSRLKAMMTMATVEHRVCFSSHPCVPWCSLSLSLSIVAGALWMVVHCPVLVIYPRTSSGAPHYPSFLAWHKDVGHTHTPQACWLSICLFVLTSQTSLSALGLSCAKCRTQCVFATGRTRKPTQDGSRGCA